MADVLNQQTARKREPDVDNSLALDNVTLERSPVVHPSPAPGKQTAGAELDKTDFSFSRSAKESLDLKRTAASTAAVAPAAAAYSELNMPGKRQHPASGKSSEAAIAVSAPSGPYAPTILDKLVTFLANLLKKLERFFVKKMQKNRQTRKGAAPKVTEEDPLIQSPQLIMPAVPGRRKKKKKEAGSQNW